MSKTLRILLPVIVLVLATVLLICSVATAFVSFFGVDNYYGDIKKVYVTGITDIYQNTDGFRVTFIPDTNDNVSAKDLEKAKSIIESRLVAKKITHYELYTDTDKKQITVDFPLQSGEKKFDPYSLISSIGEKGNLTLCSGQDNTNVILEGSEDIKQAHVNFLTENPDVPVVTLELTEVGTKKFAQATQIYLGQTISIWIDDTLLSVPIVTDVITNGQVTIGGISNVEDATQLASTINSGSLPFALEVYEINEHITIAPPISAYFPMGLVFLLAVIVALICIIALLISIFILIKNILKLRNTLKE